MPSTNFSNIEIKIPHRKHSKHISFEYRLRSCKYCGELYYNIIENFHSPINNKKMSRTVYDMTAPLGNNPFLNHLEDKHDHAGQVAKERKARK
jgi:hypothetical protein